MKKIGIITLYGNYNHGNKLQNFALQETIDKLGYDAETIVLTNPQKRRKIKIYQFKRIVVALLNRLNKNNKRREQIFLNFSNDLLKVRVFPKKNEGLTGYDYVSKEYLHFFVGSDQVWNPNFVNDDNINFLRFAPKRKRSSYSASFGVSKIENQYKERYATYFHDFNGISVREETGANIIKEITGIEVPVLADPTLLLNSEEWNKIARPHASKPKKGYLLTYFLGRINKKTQQTINETARKNNLLIVDLGDPKKTKYYVCGPREFLDYIKDANVFFTDSFHGTVFSIIFDTPFVVAPKEETDDTFTRIDNLLSKFDLKTRKINNTLLESSELFKINIKRKDEIIAEELNKAVNFIKHCIEGK